MKQFHCSIWGEIEVSDLALSIIDTFIFQRLHYIKQTGLAYKVFPNAIGTRFAHSLGVYHLTKTIINEIQLKNKLQILKLFHNFLKFEFPRPQHQFLLCLEPHLFDQLFYQY